MSTIINMGGNPKDVTVHIERGGKETEICIWSDDTVPHVALSLEGARALAFCLIGITDAEKEKEE